MKAEIQRTLFFPEKLKPTKNNWLSREVAVCRETAIRSGKVAVLALPGTKTELWEYADGGRKSWQFEPLPNLERVIAKDGVEGHKTFEVSRWDGKEKLWNFLSLSAQRMSKELGREIDLEVLTPYQALSLVKETIVNGVAYEYLILSEAGEYIESGEANKTSRPDLLEIYKTDQEKFKIEAGELEERLDKMTADKILEGGFGVCRHIAALASVLYELLKERQRGLLLNGTYLLYHGENVGEEPLNAVVGSHSYNIFLTTTPEKEITLSVVDPTWVLGEGGELDYTWKRISQTCSFLTEYGDFLEVDDVRKTVNDLSTEAVKRLETFFEKESLPVRAKKGGMGIVSFLDDYVSLIGQSEMGRRGKTSEYVGGLFESRGVDRTEALSEVLRLPSYIKTLRSDGEQVIRTQRWSEINRGLREWHFSKMKREESRSINGLLGKTLENINFEWLVDLEILGSMPSSAILVELTGHFVRSCVELEITPDNLKVLLMIQQALNIARKYHIEGDLLTYGGNFLKL